ncbi:Uncharacterised protein [Candidatus Bilamarchaeum dharawalense]|uniref:Uncharacterized protein n=1 Tax=Candidatus Bilamarchaeum dharawalense TaxID=2885759 RepID=A0A5E4LWE6_9ARCH|nr:Uncharacterised protein [Candidatus Bilamarchaeum dharawalense]
MTRINRSAVLEPVHQKDDKSLVKRMLPAALVVPLLAGAMACTRPSTVSELKIPPKTVIEATEKAFGPLLAVTDPKLVKVNGICTTDCFDSSGDETPFNYGGAAVMVDVSRGGYYHKFAYNFSGSEMIWEGFGNDHLRVYIKKDGDDYLLKVAHHVGGGWLQKEGVYAGSEAIKMWFVYLNHIINGGNTYLYGNTLEVPGKNVYFSDDGRVGVYPKSKYEK